MNSLHFDEFQFARRKYPVGAEYTQEGWTSNGISFDDFARMQARPSSVARRAKRWTPAFAASDQQLRLVLLRRAWMYVHGQQTPPENFDWKEANATATHKALEELPNSYKECPAHKRTENDAHTAAVKRAGGYLELQAAIAYRAWRLGHGSVALGESLGMSPQAVRVNLQRLCEIARHMGFETFRPHYSRKRPLPKIKGGPCRAALAN